MNAIDLLMEEHRTVESVLEALCCFTAAALDEEADRRETLGQFVLLLRVFDELHHMKEENMLFEKMIEAGFPRDNGPIAVMLSDHATCRGMVGTMDALASQPDPWTEQDLRKLDATAREYAVFLRAHIAKEDNVLYPMSRQQLSATEWEALDRSFSDFQTVWQNEGRLEDFERRVTELCRTFRSVRRAP